ncbi:MAG: ribosomal protein S18-alanine N-acetyltransferase [Corynebacterium sp.]|nr:ribosomal protein S18-alanine N-acetyltransferase [Corynebacterium sp.]
MSEIIIRPGAPIDIPRMVELEQLLFAEEDPWSEAAFNAEFSTPHNLPLVAILPERPDYLLGYSILSKLGNKDPEFEIHNIAVDPEYQKCGIGTLLMSSMMEIVDSYAGPCFLEVRNDNFTAIRLYERHGFDIEGLRKNYYQPSGAHAYTMVRPAQKKES